jgi:hypothetical protein
MTLLLQRKTAMENKRKKPPDPSEYASNILTPSPKLAAITCPA